jgi:hypothetical protein
MLKHHPKTSSRLTILAGMALVAALATVPNAFAIPAMPDGGMEPAEPLVDPSSGATPKGAPATIVDASSSGFAWGTAALFVAAGLAVFAITLAVLLAGTRRGRQLAAR